MNRIQEEFVRFDAQIKQRVADGITTQDAVVACGEALDLTVHEHARFQEIKSDAVSHGALSLEEGQLVFEQLGEVPSVFNARPVHVKATLTGLFQQLLEARIARRRAK